MCRTTSHRPDLSVGPRRRNGRGAGVSMGQPQGTGTEHFMGTRVAAGWGTAGKSGVWIRQHAGCGCVDWGTLVRAKRDVGKGTPKRLPWGKALDGMSTCEPGVGSRDRVRDHQVGTNRRPLDEGERKEGCGDVVMRNGRPLAQHTLGRNRSVRYSNPRDSTRRNLSSVPCLTCNRRAHCRDHEHCTADQRRRPCVVIRCLGDYAQENPCSGNFCRQNG